MPTIANPPSNKSSEMSAEARVQFFRAKLDAEWGPHDLKRALDTRRDQILVLDTRNPEAFEEEHIPGAINIPTDQLPQRFQELPKDKDIVPYCWSVVCHLATRGALFLSEKGYRVHELAGGIEYWKEYEMPLEKGNETNTEAQIDLPSGLSGIPNKG